MQQNRADSDFRWILMPWSSPYTVLCVTYALYSTETNLTNRLYPYLASHWKCECTSTLCTTAHRSITICFALCKFNDNAGVLFAARADRTYAINAKCRQTKLSRIFSISMNVPESFWLLLCRKHYWSPFIWSGADTDAEILLTKQSNSWF